MIYAVIDTNVLVSALIQPKGRNGKGCEIFILSGFCTHV